MQAFVNRGDAAEREAALRLEGRFTKSSDFARVILSLSALAASIAMLVPYARGAIEGGRTDSEYLTALGVVCLLFIAAALWLYVSVANAWRNKNPALIVDDVGITYLPWSPSPMKWQDIKNIEMKYVWNGKWGAYFFEIFLENREKNSPERSLLNIGNLLSDRPMIRIEDLDINQEQLIEAIAQNSHFRVKDIAVEQE